MSATISAAACCKAWYEPIGLPNCSRTFRVFYRHLKCALSSAERIRRDCNGGYIDQTIIKFGATAERRLCRNYNDIEFHRANPTGHVEIVEAADAHARTARFDQEQTDIVSARTGARHPGEGIQCIASR